MSMRLLEAEPGRVVWEAVPGEEHYNPIGSVHAGFATTLLDSAMGTAFVTLAEAGTRWTTLELKANFTRTITAETGPVRCVGTVVHRGRTVVTTEARIEDGDGAAPRPRDEHDPGAVARGARLTSAAAARALARERPAAHAP